MLHYSEAAMQRPKHTHQSINRWSLTQHASAAARTSAKATTIGVAHIQTGLEMLAPNINHDFI